MITLFAVRPRQALVALAAMMTLASPAFAGPAADDMSARAPDIQREILGIEIRSAGNRCDDVERVFYNGEYNNSDFYSVFCSDSGSYMVEMRFRGQLTGRAAACASWYRNNGLRCWRPFEPRAQTQRFN